MRFVAFTVLAALAVGCSSATDAPSEPPPAPNPPRFIVGPVAPRITVGDLLQMLASFENVQPAAVTWSSDNPGVAEVTAAGLVRTLQPGTARITAKVPTYAFETPITVTVVP